MWGVSVHPTASPHRFMAKSCCGHRSSATTLLLASFRKQLEAEAGTWNLKPGQEVTGSSISEAVGDRCRTEVSIPAPSCLEALRLGQQ